MGSLCLAVGRVAGLRPVPPCQLPTQRPGLGRGTNPHPRGSARGGKPVGPLAVEAQSPEHLV